MSRIKASAIVLGLSCTLQAAAAPPLTQASPPSDPLSICMANAAQSLSFNGSVYAKHGNRVIERFFGYADAHGARPITATTRMDIGSAGKTFTAMGIALLVEQNKLKLDAPIGHYLPDAKPPFAAITIAQLLNHTSGLGNYFIPANQAAIEAASTATDLLPLALATPPAFVPGSKRAYSNSGFVVLGAIIEKVTGMPYGTFVQHQILDPLGMRDTRVDPSGSAEPMTRFSPDGMLSKPVPSPMRQLSASPAGGLFSTSPDLSRFLSALMDGRLVSRKIMSEFLAPIPNPDGSGATYGYGFTVDSTPRLRVGHGGGAPGVSADIALYPDSGWQLIALSNYDPPVATRMVTILEKAVFSADEPSACAKALADPSLYAPLSPPRH